MTDLNKVITEIAAERTRQIEQEGFDHQHDNNEGPGVLCLAGACYAMHTALQLSPEGRSRDDSAPTPWPWEDEWWKSKDPRRNLVRAAALIVAEIERIDHTFAKLDRRCFGLTNSNVVYQLAQRMHAESDDRRDWYQVSPSVREAFLDRARRQLDAQGIKP